MTASQAMVGTDSEEVSSSGEMHRDRQIDAIKQSRGLLSFRSRKMLGLYMKNGLAGQDEKKISAATSARDVKLEVIPNPPQQLSVELINEEPKKKILEARKTVRSVVTRNGGSLPNGHLKDRETGKPPKMNSESTPKVVIGEPAPTIPTKKKPLLPAKLKLLETFYEGLEAAISLLAIRRQICTFKSVCKTVEQMSKRRFLRSHLAQLKFLFPEVIEIDYVRVPDPDSRRDVWDLRISLKSFIGLPGGSPLKGAASPSRDKNAQTLRRKREFHSRLLKFAKAHSEDVDVPQDALPQRLLGGQSLSSPNVSAGSRSKDFVSDVNPSDQKQGAEQNLEAASIVQEEAHHQVPEIPDTTEAEPPVARLTEEVYDFAIVKPESVGFLDIDVTSHFPPSFRPHFQGRHKELTSMEKPDPVDFLEIGVTSHFAPSFKPIFQERQRELFAQSKISSSSVPSQAHLEPSAISSRITAHFSAFEPHFSKPREESVQEDDFSQQLQSAEVGVNSVKSSSLETRASSKSLTAELNSESFSHEETNALEAGESSLSGKEGGGQVREASTITSTVQSSIRSSTGSGALESLPAEDGSVASPAIMSPLPRMVAEIPQNHPQTPKSVWSSTPAPSPSGAANGVPSTPIAFATSVQSSPAAEHTPAYLSPSRLSHYVHDSPIPSYVNKMESCPNEPVPVKSQAAMRSLKFGSPTRPTRFQNTAEEFAPNTPQVCLPLESTPRDETKYASFLSPSQSPPATTPEPSLGKSSYFSPVRPQRSRALRFSTPEKVRDHEASVAKLSTPSSSQLFKSPQTGAAKKPPRFMSPPKSQTLSAPATPVPQTPVRSVLYSPPKRTKLSRGSLFPSDAVEEEVAHTVVPNGEEAKASMDVGCGTPHLELRSDPCSQEETSTAVKDSPSVTGKASSYISEADLAIIDNLPPELVLSVREKERKIKDENTKEQMLQKRRQQMMAGLPKMFNQLRLIFQSLKRSVLPRNDLIKNVLSTNADITDRGEVEERLKLLVELAPDWISKQPSASGDYIYRINKTANITRIQKKILEAC